MRTSFLLPIGIIVCTMSLAATIAAAEELSEHVLLLEEFAGGAGLPSGWELRGDGKVVVTAEAAHCGQYSLRVDDTSNADGAGANSKPVSVRPGVQYVATAWAKTKSGAVQFHLLFFDAAGKLIGLTAATEGHLLRKFTEVVGKGLLPPEKAIRLFSTNAADFYGFKDKGRLAEGGDADIILTDGDYRLTDVFACGRLMMRKGRITARGTFSAAQ